MILTEEPATARAASVIAEICGTPTPEIIRVVQIEPGPDTWPQAAALADALDRDGIDLTVTKEWVPMYDPRFAPTGDPVVRLSVVPTTGQGSSTTDRSSAVLSRRSVTVIARFTRG